MTIDFTLNGHPVAVAPGNAKRTLLDALRSDLGITSTKDGCAPQGQCGCCTVLVDGKARVACVTPLRRVSGREVVTLEGLDAAVADGWAEALGAHGGSQCGFCTPGIIMRLEDRRLRRVEEPGRGTGTATAREVAVEVQRGLAAHLCRCTGWQGICDAACEVLLDPSGIAAPGQRSPNGTDTARDADTGAVNARAALEGGSPQHVDRSAILGGGGFASDTAPADALVALLGSDGEWVLGETLTDARELGGKVQGRRSTLSAEPPLSLPTGEWAATLRTSWVEPGYLETDASWCVPGGEPAGTLANAGAFGAKLESPLPHVARRLADESGRAVLAMWSREDSVRLGPKRPPVAGGIRSDGSGRIDVAADGATFDAMRDSILGAAPGLEVHPADITGPPSSASIRSAGWAEAFCLATAAGIDSPLGGLDGDAVTVRLGTGAQVSVRVVPPVKFQAEAVGQSVGAAGPIDAGFIEVDVSAGDVLSEQVLESYVIGAVHMAAGWVTSEGLAVDAAGEIQDLTIRSFGILPASALPRVIVRFHGSGRPVAVSDAVFVASAAAIWRHHGYGPDWPLRTAII